jgi:hypothetical protein
MVELSRQSANGIDVLYDHAYAYARNNPIRLIDPSGEQATECIKYFPPSVILTTGGGKIGPKCKPETLHITITKCLQESLAEPGDFSACMEKACGPGNYKVLIDAVCEWVAYIYCCRVRETSGKSPYVPCDCGVDPDATKKTVRKCLDPAKDMFANQEECRHCCDYTLCLQGVKEACNLLKKGGKLNVIELAIDAATSDKTTLNKCYLNCADCP